jgi:hypothetical protein
MVLFLVASLPLLFSLVALLPWDRGRGARRLATVSTYLKGLLIFFPGYLIMLIFRRIFGFSSDGVLLYFSFLLRDHLIPGLVAVAGFLLLQKKLTLSGKEEDTFLTVFACMAGFMTLLNIADALRTLGSWETYSLFLLPLLRMCMVLAVALVAGRFYRWEGRDAASFSGVVAACAVALTFASFLYGSSRVVWSILLTTAFFLAACLVVAFRFPRVLRG